MSSVDTASLIDARPTGPHRAARPQAVTSPGASGAAETPETCEVSEVSASSDSAEPILERGLQALMARGFQFVHPRDADGEVLAVVGVRVHNGMVDVVRLHAEDDATATRVCGGEKDVLQPERVLWSSTGSVCTVLTDLLALPDEYRPETPEPAAAANGCWISAGRGGRAKWLAAS